MGDFITEDDLPANTGQGIGLDVESMIDDAEAMAVLAAPCITSDTFANQAAVKAILRGALMRWSDSGSGAFQSQTAGPFSTGIDTRQERRGMFWPSEIAQLRDLCATNQGNVYTVSMAGPDPVPGDGITLA